jgi:hypothetical protein
MLNRISAVGYRLWSFFSHSICTSLYANTPQCTAVQANYAGSGYPSKGHALYLDVFFPSLHVRAWFSVAELYLSGDSAIDTPSIQPCEIEPSHENGIFALSWAT